MIYWLLSGEGASDLGSPNGQDFIPGPMGLLLAQMVGAYGQQLNYGTNANFKYVHKKELTEKTNSLRPAKKSIKLPGLEHKKETRYFFNNARALAFIAADMGLPQGYNAVVAVLFRDSDGTASAERGLWQDKHKSMLHGFDDGNFSRGVPMLPKPKSEAWLICALQRQPNQHCASLEERSGNDDSPNSLKQELAALAPEEQNVAEWLARQFSSGNINPSQLSMPSFNAFRDRLHQVLSQIA